MCWHSQNIKYTIVWSLKKESNKLAVLFFRSLFIIFIIFQRFAEHARVPQRVSSDFHFELAADPEWDVPFDKIHVHRELGRGAFGVVYLASAPGILASDKEEQHVALKTVKGMTSCSIPEHPSRPFLNQILCEHPVGLQLVGRAAELFVKCIAQMIYCIFGDGWPKSH